MEPDGYIIQLCSPPLHKVRGSIYSPEAPAAKNSPQNRSAPPITFNTSPAEANRLSLNSRLGFDEHTSTARIVYPIAKNMVPICPIHTPI